jgi:hypothetical protein
MTVFGSLRFDIICTCRYVSPESNARVMAVLRRSCGETAPKREQSAHRATIFCTILEESDLLNSSVR